MMASLQNRGTVKAFLRTIKERVTSSSQALADGGGYARMAGLSNDLTEIRYCVERIESMLGTDEE
jgi:hypothetical protein